MSTRKYIMVPFSGYILGTLAFSGSLYLKICKIEVPSLAPIGGLSMLISWIILAFIWLNFNW